MSMRLPGFVTIALAAVMLDSCSYTYDVRAVAKNGSVVFTIAGTGVFNSRTPYVDGVLVDRIGKSSRRVWKLDTQESNGPEIHELRYGEAPAKMKTTVGPTPLDVGQLYRVTFFTIDGGGEDLFVITDIGEVLNVPP